MFSQAATMANSVSTADVDSLCDRLGSVRFPGMYRAVNIVVPDELEGLPVVLGGVIRFGAGEIKANDTTRFVGDSEFGHFIGRRGGNISDAANDNASLNSEGLSRSAQPIQHGFDNLGELQALLRVQHWGIAHLHVANILCVGVFSQLICDPTQ